MSCILFLKMDITMNVTFPLLRFLDLFMAIENLDYMEGVILCKESKNFLLSSASKKLRKAFMKEKTRCYLDR